MENDTFQVEKSKPVASRIVFGILSLVLLPLIIVGIGYLILGEEGFDTLDSDTTKLSSFLPLLAVIVIPVICAILFFVSAAKNSKRNALIRTNLLMNITAEDYIAKLSQYEMLKESYTKYWIILSVSVVFYFLVLPIGIIMDIITLIFFNNARKRNEKLKMQILSEKTSSSETIAWNNQSI